MDPSPSTLAEIAERYGIPWLLFCGLLYMLWRSRSEVVARGHHDQVVEILDREIGKLREEVVARGHHDQVVEILEREIGELREEVLRYRDLAFRLASLRTSSPTTSTPPPTSGDSSIASRDEGSR